MEKTAISGIVLAGGKSSRMGSDKAWTHFKGKPLIEHAIHSIKPYCTEILISARGEAYSALPYPVYPDALEGLGPIGGIASTLTQAKNELVLITACDIPLLDEDLIQVLAENIQVNDMVYLQLESGQIQPLPFILSKKFMPVVQDQISVGNYKLQDLIRSILSQEGVNCSACSINKEPLNINRPEDLA